MKNWLIVFATIFLFSCSDETFLAQELEIPMEEMTQCELETPGVLTHRVNITFTHKFEYTPIEGVDAEFKSFYDDGALWDISECKEKAYLYTLDYAQIVEKIEYDITVPTGIPTMAHWSIVNTVTNETVAQDSVFLSSWGSFELNL